MASNSGLDAVLHKNSSGQPIEDESEDEELEKQIDVMMKHLDADRILDKMFDDMMVYIKDNAGIQTKLNAIVDEAIKPIEEGSEEAIPGESVGKALNRGVDLNNEEHKDIMIKEELCDRIIEEHDFLKKITRPVGISWNIKYSKELEKAYVAMESAES